MRVPHNNNYKATPSDTLVSGPKDSLITSGRADILIIVIILSSSRLITNINFFL